ncbi:putative bifunctional diguanylate cyclase/phosphodiesterase [Paenisporosarcina quisquiliarum]|uniref:putative bifunctional diguanylate cyclase/phosphodiesterase n=1 Tax=Paenisporosarcina quisquiliarum TaxID=365346 RepID=UPI0037366AE9
MKWRWQIGIAAVVLIGNVFGLVQNEFSWERTIVFPINIWLGWLIGLQVDKYLHSKKELDSTRSVLMDYSLALDSAIDAIGITNSEGNYEFVNESFAQLHGYTKEELSSMHWQELYPTESLQDIRKEMIKPLFENGFARGESIGLRKNGSTFHQSASLSLMKEHQKTIVVIHDITQQKEEERRLKQKVELNELTGLANRRKLLMELEKRKTADSSTCILFIDLDRFKIVNDTLGHEVGDYLLRDVANRLRFFNKKNISTYHLGGDEFIAMICDSDLDHVKVVAYDIVEYLREPYYIEGNEIFLTASIGISTTPDHTNDVFELIGLADTAMYYAKLDGKNTYKIFTEQLKSQLERRTFIDSELRKAVKNNELFMVYQPKINLLTNELWGMEALIRWDHPTLGLISPLEFIPIAEDSAIILDITKWVVNDVLEQMRIWHLAGYPKFNTSINVSQRQLRDSSFVDFLHDSLQVYEIDPPQLEIEVTESVMENAELVIPILRDMKEIGVCISIDDFGTGYSSLNLLKTLPIDTLKIDQSFMNDLHGNEKDIALLKTIITIGQTFNLNIVAEGTETEDQLCLLQSLGCTIAQGYYFSKPIKAIEFEKQYLNNFLVLNESSN